MSLLSDIAAYAERTGTPPALIGRQALNDTTFVEGLRRGRTPRPETEQRVRQFLARHPEGLTARRGRPDAVARGRLEAPIEAGVLPPVVDRTPCPSCGVRGDIGCAHGRAGVNW